MIAHEFENPEVAPTPADLLNLPDLEIIPEFEPTDESIEPDNLVGLYLKSISRIPLLKPEEEQNLGRLIRRCDPIKNYAANLLQQRLGQKPAERILNHYLDNFLQIADTVSKNTIGLIAVEQKIINTAAKIRQALGRAVADQSRTIRVPVYMHTSISDYDKTVARLTQKLGKFPTDGEVALESGLSPETIRLIKGIFQRPASLQTPIGDGGDILGDLQADPHWEAPLEAVDKRIDTSQVHELFKHLSPRETLVIWYRFGFEDGESETLEQVGKRLRVTRERVRQIEMKAIEKLQPYAKNYPGLRPG